VCQRLLCDIEHFHGVHPSEVLPVEPVRPAVSRGDDMEPPLGRVRSGLAVSLHAGSVARQDDSGQRIVRRAGCGRQQAEILHRVVELADERDPATLVGLDDLETQRHLVTGYPIPRQ